MVAFQPQKKDAPYMTTSEVNEKAELHLVANRDPNGWAKGRIVFTDDSDSSVAAGQYESYEFHLSAGSLKSWNMNRDNLNKVGRGLDAITIVDVTPAESTQTDYACWVAQNDIVYNLEIIPDTTQDTLTFRDAVGPIDLTQFRNLYYGNS